MRASVVVGMLLFAALGSFSACRELVGPGELDLTNGVEARVRGQLLRPDGAPVRLALLQIDNVPYIDWDAGEEPVTWRGSTDNEGHFDAPLAFRGYFDLAMQPTVDTDLPEYVFIGLHTDAPEPVIQYEGELVQASMVLPTGMPAIEFGTGDLRLRETVIRPVTGETYRLAVNPILNAEGTLQG